MSSSTGPITRVNGVLISWLMFVKKFIFISASLAILWFLFLRAILFSFSIRVCSFCLSSCICREALSLLIFFSCIYDIIRAEKIVIIIMHNIHTAILCCFLELYIIFMSSCIWLICESRLFISIYCCSIVCRLLLSTTPVGSIVSLAYCFPLSMFMARSSTISPRVGYTNEAVSIPSFIFCSPNGSFERASMLTNFSCGFFSRSLDITLMSGTIPSE